jgi:membrane protein
MPLRLGWRVLDRSLGEGAAYAGNLAYMAMVTIFPFFLVIAAIGAAFGRTEDGRRVLDAFLQAVPDDVAAVIAGPIEGLIAARSGDLLTIAIIVGLWSASGFVETLRDIVRRAYGARAGPAWRNRLLSVAGILVLALLLLVAFALQFIAVGAEQVVLRLMPEAMRDLAHAIGLYRLVPMAVIFLALWLLFALFTPMAWRPRAWRWPGALLTAAVWMGATTLLPGIIARVANYHLTYGSLAGVMITLLFFYIVGLGLVMGANLNAELAGAHAPVKHGSIERA